MGYHEICRDGRCKEREECGYDEAKFMEVEGAMIW